jgi:hypothetical protein
VIRSIQLDKSKDQFIVNLRNYGFSKDTEDGKGNKILKLNINDEEKISITELKQKLINNFDLLLFDQINRKYIIVKGNAQEIAITNENFDQVIHTIKFDYNKGLIRDVSLSCSSNYLIITFIKQVKIIQLYDLKVILELDISNGRYCEISQDEKYLFLTNLFDGGYIYKLKEEGIQKNINYDTIDYENLLKENDLTIELLKNIPESEATELLSNYAFDLALEKAIDIYVEEAFELIPIGLKVFYCTYHFEQEVDEGGL